MAPRLPAARRRKQLLDVALDVFADKGFHETSMNDVAEAAGVTKPVLYQHFRSKRELFGELLADVGRDLQDAITKAVASAQTSHEMVDLGFAAFFRYVDAHRNAFVLFWGHGSTREDEFAGLVEKVEDTLADIPSRSSRLRLVMGTDFFSQSFSPLDRTQRLDGCSEP